MKNGWEIKTLGEVCEKITRGISPKYTDGKGVTVLNQKCIRDHKIDLSFSRLHDDASKKVTAEKFIKLGDVLVNSTGEGTLGRVAQVQELISDRITVDSHVSIVRPYLGKFYPDFFGYAMIFIENEITESGAGASGQTELARTVLENSFKITYPSLISEQRHIVSILDEAFAAIDKAKTNTEKNLQNAKELFESYLQAVFANPGEDWVQKRLEDVAKVSGGYSFKSTDFKKSGKYQVLRMGNVRPGIIRGEESPVFIDKIEESALSRALLKRGDVIITQTGTKNKRDYGFTVIINQDNYLLNQRIASIRFSENYLAEFFLYYSWTNSFKDQFFANETGTVGQGNVGIGAVTDAMVPVCSLDEQRRIVSKIKSLSTETKKLESIYQQKLNDLEELKKSILQKSFRGELKTKQEVLV